MKKWHLGSRVYSCKKRHGVRKPRQWLPRCEKYFYLSFESLLYLIHWKPWHGLFVRAVHLTGVGGVSRSYTYHRPGSPDMKKPNTITGLASGRPSVVAASTMWGKLPKLREFLTAPAYEDGTARTPGYMWIKTTTTQWVVTLFEPDAGCRLDCRGANLDDTLALAEKFLMADDAPWEIDEYLQARNEKKGKKKKT